MTKKRPRPAKPALTFIDFLFGPLEGVDAEAGPAVVQLREKLRGEPWFVEVEYLPPVPPETKGSLLVLCDASKVSLEEILATLPRTWHSFCVRGNPHAKD